MSNDDEFIRLGQRIGDLEDELARVRHHLERRIGVVPDLPPLAPLESAPRWPPLTRSERERVAQAAHVELRTVEAELEGKPGKRSVRERVRSALWKLLAEIDAPEPAIPPKPDYANFPSSDFGTRRYLLECEQWERAAPLAEAKHAEWNRRREARARQLEAERATDGR